MSEYTGHAILELMSAHATNRNAWIESLIVTELELNDENPKSILEFGAGQGEFCFRLKKYEQHSIEVVENDERYFSNLSSHFKSYRDLREITKQYDCIYLIDVLEHLEDDEAYLNQFYALLNPGGKLFIFVPARSELFSDFDRKIGHFRRYKKLELEFKVQAAGFIIQRSGYNDLLGYLLMLIQKKLFRHTHPTPFSVKTYDKLFVPVSKLLEKLIIVPIGKSIYLTAKKGK